MTTLERLTSSNIVNDRAAEGSWQGAPLGNGDMGAVAWGDGAPLVFSLDKADFWELRGPDVDARREFTMRNLRRWVAQGRLEDLRRVFENRRNVLGNPQGSEPYQTKLPVGQARLRIGWRMTNCRSRLSLANGLYTQELAFVRGAKAKVEAFVAREMNVICLRVSVGCAKGESSNRLHTRELLEFDSISSFGVAGCERAGIAVCEPLASDVTRIAKQWGYPPPAYGRDRHAAWWIQRTPEGKGLVTMWRQGRSMARGGRRVVELYLGIEYGREEDALDRVRANLDRAVGEGFDNLVRATGEFWRDYWSRSAVSVPSPACSSFMTSSATSSPAAPVPAACRSSSRASGTPPTNSLTTAATSTRT